MLIKDKDILADTIYGDNPKMKVSKEHMRSAWGDVFDYFLRGITARYLKFSGRASRLEFWGFILVNCLVFILIYPLGYYIDMPMLAYYYACATLLPTVAVFARRLHDLNKSTILYLGVLIAAFLSTLVIGYLGLLLVVAWFGFLCVLLFKPTDETEGLYGAAPKTDEQYGTDNMPILKKFRMLAVSLFVICCGTTFISFDDWRVQAEFKGTKDKIMEDIEKGCRTAQLNEEQCIAAKDAMIQTLKEWSGETVTQEAIDQAIEKALKSVAELSAKMGQAAGQQ